MSACSTLNWRPFADLEAHFGLDLFPCFTFILGGQFLSAQRAHSEKREISPQQVNEIEVSKCLGLSSCLQETVTTSGSPANSAAFTYDPCDLA